MFSRAVRPPWAWRLATACGRAASCSRASRSSTRCRSARMWSGRGPGRRRRRCRPGPPGPAAAAAGLRPRSRPAATHRCSTCTAPGTVMPCCIFIASSTRAVAAGGQGGAGFGVELHQLAGHGRAQADVGHRGWQLLTEARRGAALAAGACGAASVWAASVGCRVGQAASSQRVWMAVVRHVVVRGQRPQQWQVGGQAVQPAFGQRPLRPAQRVGKACRRVVHHQLGQQAVVVGRGGARPLKACVSTRTPGQVGQVAAGQPAGDEGRAWPASSSVSALMRHWIATPCAAGGWAGSSPSCASVCPAATAICAATRSTPVTASVTVCSTCRRGLASMKTSGRSGLWSSTRNSKVPRPQ